MLRPKSRGTVGLLSADPLSAPRIDPQFLSDSADLDVLLRGVTLGRRIMDTPAFAALQPDEMYTAGIRNDEGLREQIKKRADTIYHPVGTCRMGHDALAVVAPDLRVRGLDGLWLTGDTTRARGVGIDKAARSGITSAEAVLGSRLPTFADTVHY